MIFLNIYLSILQDLGLVSVIIAIKAISMLRQNFWDVNSFYTDGDLMEEDFMLFPFQLYIPSRVRIWVKTWETVHLQISLLKIIFLSSNSLINHFLNKIICLHFCRLFSFIFIVKKTLIIPGWKAYKSLN